MNRMSKVTVSMLAGSLALMLPVLAHADDDLTLRLQPGVAFPLNTPQSDRFNPGGALEVQGLVALTPWLAVGPAVGVVALPSKLSGIDPGTAWEAGITGLVRRPHNNTAVGLDANSAWLGADFQIVKTGDLVAKPAFSLAAGIDWPTTNTRTLWVGPFVRFQNVFDPGTDPNLNKSDAKIGIIGLNFEFGAGRGPNTTSASDRDGDGVPDAVDRCPDVPGPKANDGCPWHTVKVVPGVNLVPTAPTVHRQPFHLEIKHKIQFDYDSAVLRGDSASALKEVLGDLLAHTNYRVVIQGHASAEGNTQHNTVLSLHRAQSVLEFLVSNGVDRDRLAAVGFGSSKPIADNSTQVGRETNRRVEFEVTLTISDDGESK